MHSQFSIVLLLATVASVVNCQSFPDEASLPGCGQTCLDTVVQGASTFGCSDGSVSCLCAVPDFQNGVRDCASAACAADLFPSVTSYLTGVCASPTVAASTPAVPSATSLTVSTPVPATSAPVALPSTSIAAPATSSIMDTAAPFSTTSPIVPQSTASGPVSFSSTAAASGFPLSTIPATASTPSSTLGSGPNSTAAVGGTFTSGSSFPTASDNGAVATAPISPSPSAASITSTPTPAPSLSVGAKAGIGIGAAVGAVAAIAAIVVCVIGRKNKSRQQQPGPRLYHISEPMPGAGRIYANDNGSQEFERVSELEMKSRRYEDMMPRHVPRNMV